MTNTPNHPNTMKSLSPKPSWPRVVGKFLLFTRRGHSPATAGWLAVRDATITNDYRRIPHSELEAAWSAVGAWPDLQCTNGSVRSLTIGLNFLGNDLLTRNYTPLLALTTLGFKVRRVEAGLEISNSKLTLCLSTDEEVNMAHEIFVQHCYDLNLPGSWCVLDIGANVGIASLYFAAQPWVKRVFAFEPFAPTAACCKANLNLNPNLAPKVRLETIGLSDRNTELETDYHRDLCGSMTLTGLGEWRGSPAVTGVKVSLEIRNVADVLARLSPEFHDCSVVAKIDCEGSEYAIIAELGRTGLLTMLDVIVMEWHGARVAELVEPLRTAGFGMLLRPLVDDGRLGLLVAWRHGPSPAS